MNKLQHFGILGMHWGIRRSRSSGEESGGGKTNHTKPKAQTEDTSSEDHKKVAALKKKKVSELSNAEMQSVITRANLEKQFAEINKKQVSAGQKFVTDLIANTGKQLATQYVQDYAKKSMATMMKGGTP